MQRAPGGDPEALWMGWWKSCSEQEGKQGQRPEEEEEGHEPDGAHDQGRYDLTDHYKPFKCLEIGRPILQRIHLWFFRVVLRFHFISM